jgi:hypothetical protein
MKRRGKREREEEREMRWNAKIGEERRDRRFANKKYYTPR